MGFGGEGQVSGGGEEKGLMNLNLNLKPYTHHRNEFETEWNNQSNIRECAF